jgi:hypothetical protein
MSNRQINFFSLLAALILISFSLLLINFAWNWHKNVNEAMHAECKMCSIFEKNCPYTDEELTVEEYEPGPCSDMGLYEMSWKISLGVVFMGICLIGIGIATIYSGIVPGLKYKKN